MGPRNFSFHLPKYPLVPHPLGYFKNGAKGLCRLLLLDLVEESPALGTRIGGCKAVGDPFRIGR